MFKILGFIFVGLATLGAFLPLLPTTPFLLLAAGCFARSSKKWHNWLIQNPTFGKLIQDWQAHRCIPLKSKVIALSMIMLFGGSSVLFAVDHIYLKIFGACVVLYGIYFVGRLKTCKNISNAEEVKEVEE